VSTPTCYCLSTEDVIPRAAGYGLVTESVDGDDVFDVFASCKKHVDDMRLAPHPVFIEAKVHRQLGHWIGDPQKYRTLEELKNLPDFDPIRIFLNKIKCRSDIKEEDLNEINLILSDEIRKAAIFAEKSPYPSAEEAVKDFLKE
jgi:pyruvate dehydrogenase E1 component alpha subunit